MLRKSGFTKSSLLCLLVQFETEGHQAIFSIKIRHGVTPKLYNTGSKGGKTQHQHANAAHNLKPKILHIILFKHWALLGCLIFLLCRVQCQCPRYHSYEDFPALWQASRSYRQREEILSHRHYSDRWWQWKPQKHRRALHWTLHHAFWKGLESLLILTSLPSSLMFFGVQALCRVS